MSEQLLHQILHKLDHIESEQQSMKSDIQSMKSDMQLMKSDIQSMKETDAKLDALSMDVHKLHGEVASVKTKQERLEIIVEKLSARSLEQESEIRSIRLAK